MQTKKKKTHSITQNIASIKTNQLYSKHCTMAWLFACLINETNGAEIKSVISQHHKALTTTANDVPGAL